MGNEFKFADLFCGLGGFRIALEALGGRCVFSSDSDRHIQDTYERNFNERPSGDTRNVESTAIPDFDVLTAGFPCQPFGISGHKKGFDDTRGTLFFDICRIIESHNPKIVILENVKHLMHHNKKKTITTILKTLNRLGYFVTYSLLNANSFGLPQNRERIFIVASKLGIFDFHKLDTVKTRPLVHFLNDSFSHEYLDRSEYTLLDKGMVRIQPLSGLIFVGYRNKNRFSKGVNTKLLHLNRLHRQPNRIYSVYGNHPTLPSQESAGRFFIYHPEKDNVRKLSIEECFTIMGFPQKYKRVSTLGEQYRQIGNSIAIPIVSSIMKQIIQQGLLKNVRTSKSNSKITWFGKNQQLALVS